MAVLKVLLKGTDKIAAVLTGGGELERTHQAFLFRFSRAAGTH